jgi:hypothetical protein
MMMYLLLHRKATHKTGFNGTSASGKPPAFGAGIPQVRILSSQKSSKTMPEWHRFGTSHIKEKPQVSHPPTSFRSSREKYYEVQERCLNGIVLERLI